MNINLSAEDITKIANYISDFSGSYCHQVAEEEIPHILRFWDEEKSWLYNEVFNHQLILEKEFEFINSTEIIKNNVANLYSLEFAKTFLYNYSGPTKKAIKYVPYEHAAEFFSLLDDRYLCSNIYTGPTFYIELPSTGKPYKIQNGCKVMRVLQKIAQEFEYPGFEEFRRAHSLCLNQKKITGTICLSIHPLDYMTMSDNYAGWDSCMSWINEGEYRQGTVEMMNSPYVIVAYIKEKEDKKYNDVLWNSKKWRQLFVVSPEIIMGIKQYPYYNEEFNTTVLFWIKSLMEKAGYNNYTEHFYNFTGAYNQQFIPECVNSPINLQFPMNCMYNDICRDVTTYMFVSKNIPKQFVMELSGVSECMNCGEIISQDDCDPGYLWCFDCFGQRRCYDCGDIYSIDELTRTPNGHYICEYCLNDNYDRCRNCDELTETPHYVYVHQKDDVFMSEIALCDECFETIKPYLSDTNHNIFIDENTPEELYEILEDCGLIVNR